MTTALITGADGFIGSHLTEKLVAAPILPRTIGIEVDYKF